ncbi:MAG: isoprenylcysteine carboxylmethyltransferase family protein [Zoogloeaceae bacterium]|jgi:protein-S-isoprenylcysteine O-methyltransferase Ste14|nr:isoprenylcysteine carboxylmethyltransferase family protein [Zoogloeaceae bacterium]
MATIPVRWQRWLDIYLFLNVTGYFVWQGWRVFDERRLDFIEGVFIVHTAIFCLCFLLRAPARAIQTKIGHQAIALCAFYSGALFMGPETTQSPLLLQCSRYTLLAGMLLGIAALIQLGRSFGVLIAAREVRTTGLYGWIRHPMYLSDIVMRFGYFLSHPSWLVAMLLVVSSVCYIARAMLEESFLTSASATYADYMRRVRYRFVPGVF